MLNKLLRDPIKNILIKAALIVVRLCHRWVHTSWVDRSADHAADIVYLVGSNLWRGRTQICIEMTKYMCACIIDHVINVSCIALTLCSTSQTELWRDPNLACFAGRQTMLNTRCGEGTECQVDFINQWFIVHSHLSYAKEVCLVNKIHNFSHCKSKLALLIW